MEEQLAAAEETASPQPRPARRKKQVPAALIVICLIGLVIWIGYLIAPAFDSDPLGLKLTPETGQWSPAALREAHSLIDVDEILSGGPPKDGIPALTDPPVVNGDGRRPPGA